VLIIAHRLSTVRRTDRIITIERGRLVEDGNHDELIYRRRATSAATCRWWTVRRRFPAAPSTPPT
jgi:ABC-type multidrug transport system fused ATPase/permease subunit